MTTIAATLFAAGVAFRVRSMQGAPVMQVPVFLALLTAPVYVPLGLIEGWVHTVAEVNPVEALKVGVQRAVYVTDSAADARAAAEEARWNMRVTLSLRNHYERVEQGRAIPVPAPKEPDVDDLLDRFLVIGTPDTVIRQITRIREAVGITHFNCSFWFGDLEHARVLRSMELFAREVMPAFGGSPA